MARKVFFSFHYALDNWRASQVRNMGVVEGNSPVADNDWESVTKGGDAAIERWIIGQMAGRTCSVLLIGAETAGRKWINYEIEQAWARKLGLVAIHIHRLKDRNQQATVKGVDPLTTWTINGSGEPLSKYAKTYDPPYWESTDVYAYIAANISQWVEQAILLRALAG